MNIVSKNHSSWFNGPFSPLFSLRLVLKLTFDPDSLCSEVSSLRDSLMSAMNRVDASSIQGFITSYGFLCDFFGIPFNNEVSWVSCHNKLQGLSLLHNQWRHHLHIHVPLSQFMKHVYLSHGIRDLNMSDFNHLTIRYNNIESYLYELTITHCYLRLITGKSSLC